jgi:hypothetical protein
MKSSNLFSKLKVAGVVAISLGSFSGALAQDSGKPATQISNESIGAAINANHDFVDIVLRKMKESTDNVTMNSSDYKIKSQDFQNRIKTALANFTSTLENDIAIELDGSIKSYNDIFSSNAYTEDQKRDLVPALQSRLGQLTQRLSSRYSNEIIKLYAVAGALPARCTSEYEQSYRSCERFADNQTSQYPVQLSTVSGQSLAEKLTSTTTAFQSLVYPVISKGCYSRSCIDHSDAETILYLSLVRASFDRPLNFKIQGDLVLHLVGPSLDTTYLIGLLSRADYPSSNDALPLYVQEGQMQKVKTEVDARNQAELQAQQQTAEQIQSNQKKRQALLEKFASSLSDGKCDQKVMTQICSLPGSCLTQNEGTAAYRHAEQSLQESGERKIYKRLACYQNIRFQN